MLYLEQWYELNSFKLFNLCSVLCLNGYSDIFKFRIFIKLLWAILPKVRTALIFFKLARSLSKNLWQLFISFALGLLFGGTHFTAFVIAQFFNENFFKSFLLYSPYR